MALAIIYPWTTWKRTALTRSKGLPAGLGLLFLSGETERPAPAPWIAAAQGRHRSFQAGKVAHATSKRRLHEIATEILHRHELVLHP